MRQKYRTRQQVILDRLDQLRALLRGDERWWNRSSFHTPALGRFEAFVENLERNFGEDSPCRAQIDSEANWARYHAGVVDRMRDAEEERQRMIEEEKRVQRETLARQKEELYNRKAESEKERLPEIGSEFFLRFGQSCR